MEILVISDTHGKHRELKWLPKADVIVFAGDFMSCGYKESEVNDFLKWFNSLDYNNKILVAGNHDRYVEHFPKDFKEKLLGMDITYLQDSAIVIHGLTFYGTPWSRHFGGWAFNRSEVELTSLFDKIPNDVDVLISHAPQNGRLDNLMDGRNVGEMSLTKKIRTLNNLKLHCVGHIHESFGVCKPLGEFLTVNAAQVDESYELVNQPILVKL